MRSAFILSPASSARAATFDVQCRHKDTPSAQNARQLSTGLSGTGAGRLASRSDGVDRPVVANASIRDLEEALRQRNEQLHQKEDQLRIKNAKIQELEAQLQRQGERLPELERRLGLTSSNSSKPPSSDGLRKPPTAPKRGDDPKRRPGGQKGHDGTTLRRTETPDRIAHYFPEVCSHCGTVFTEHTSIAQAIRQVHDLPEPASLIVTDHIAHRCVCPGCQKTTQASFPDGIKATVQYGPTLSSLMVYLNTYQLIPTQRLVETFRDLFGVTMSQGTYSASIWVRGARQTGWNMLDTLHRSPHELSTALVTDA